jgi:hypothetical protein
MTEWTREALEAQGYQLYEEDGTVPNAIDRSVNRNAAHRESLLPSSRSAGQPLADAERPVPRTEVERLFPDRERVARKQARLAED